jgi:hypothetical protein
MMHLILSGELKSQEFLGQIYLREGSNIREKYSIKRCIGVGCQFRSPGEQRTLEEASVSWCFD